MKGAKNNINLKNFSLNNNININKTANININQNGPYLSANTDLHSILIGIMLGDGSLFRSSPTANVRFEMSFGQKYEEFSLFLGNLFKEYMSNPVKALKIKGKTKIYINYRLKTKSLPIFKQYYEMFYEFDKDLNKYKKIIPKNIGELMNPIILAYLIMTDGNFDKGRNRVRIYTNSYNKKEVENLAKAINIKFNIYVGVLHDRKNQWILTIGAKNLDLLRDIVSKYFHNSMLYRIGL
jgi:hypothetical protein